MSASVNEIDLLSQENGVSLNLDHLADLLCRNDVADQPIAVIGIVGPIRTGKSFLLSYLSRYLRSQGWLDSDDWMGDDQTSLRDGFSWQGGKDPHTQGVKASNEIFRVVDKNGKQLNVLLIDTQGLFGSSMTKDNDGKLFTLSGALCSTLIFNVERKIDERQLESLEFFTQYATAAYSQNDHQEARTVPQLQNLIFLVRDWAYAYEHDFGASGGKSYVDECLLMSKTNCPEGNSVRQNLRSVIKRIDGFLLPHPGLNVEQIDFSGTNEEVSREFLEGVAELAGILVNAETLEPRMLGDEPTTGRRLLSLMKACDETLRNGTIPEVHNTFSVFSKLTASTAAEKACKEFQLRVEQVATNGGNTDGLYESQLKESLRHYVLDTVICSDAVQEEYMDRLTLKCQECFVNTFDWSDFQKRQAYNASIQAVNGAWSDYKQSMKDAMGLNAKPEKTLTEMHERYHRVALKDYKDEVTSRAAFDVDHYRLLQDLINKSWNKFKEINDIREGPAVLFKTGPTNQYEARVFLNGLTEHFREEIEKFSHLYLDEKELQEQVIKLQSEFLEIFDKHWIREWPEIHSYRQELLDVLAREHDDCMHCNSRNKEVLLNVMDESVSKGKAIYHDAMSKAIRNGYCEPRALKNAHEQARQFVMNKVKDELKDIERSLSDEKFRQLEAFTDSEYQKFCKLNHCNKPTEKATDPGNSVNIMDFLNKANLAMPIVTMSIKRLQTFVGCMKSAEQSVTAISKFACSLGGKTSFALPYVLIGVAVTAGAAAIGYCVYRWYQKRNQGRQLKIDQ